MTINRTQRLVLGFFALAWVGLLLTLVLAPEVYAAALGPGSDGERMPILLFVVALTSFLGLLTIGTVRRWRWVFWLILVAFLFGILRVPVAAVQLGGGMDQPGPHWYAVLQALLGLIQFAIAIAMLVGYRRAGTWAAF